MPVTTLDARLTASLEGLAALRAKSMPRRAGLAERLHLWSTVPDREPAVAEMIQATCTEGIDILNGMQIIWRDCGADWQERIAPLPHFWRLLDRCRAEYGWWREVLPLLEAVCRAWILQLRPQLLATNGEALNSLDLSTRKRQMATILGVSYGAETGGWYLLSMTQLRSPFLNPHVPADQWPAPYVRARAHARVRKMQPYVKPDATLLCFLEGVLEDARGNTVCEWAWWGEGAEPQWEEFQQNDKTYCRVTLPLIAHFVETGPLSLGLVSAVAVQEAGQYCWDHLAIESWLVAYILRVGDPKATAWVPPAIWRTGWTSVMLPLLPQDFLLPPEPVWRQIKQELNEAYLVGETDHYLRRRLQSGHFATLVEWGIQEPDEGLDFLRRPELFDFWSDLLLLPPQSREVEYPPPFEQKLYVHEVAWYSLQGKRPPNTLPERHPFAIFAGRYMVQQAEKAPPPLQQAYWDRAAFYGAGEVALWELKKRWETPALLQDVPWLVLQAQLTEQMAVHWVVGHVLAFLTGVAYTRAGNTLPEADVVWCWMQLHIGRILAPYCLRVTMNAQLWPIISQLFPDIPDLAWAALENVGRLYMPEVKVDPVHIAHAVSSLLGCMPAVFRANSMQEILRASEVPAQHIVEGSLRDLVQPPTPTARGGRRSSSLNLWGRQGSERRQPQELVTRSEPILS
ncbi:MAG: hypothetical protein A3J38_02420 [Gammaproteobacteria bacterium RIFCSPHIGHO2_12_FULL_45_9]|nr:MAG: hypothetical protein A3J38_02420 [Gammaproteobacteria bacterium RIFCSPHIGHO2_12_FULL_45_9]